MTFEIVENQVIVDGVDVSDLVASITIEWADGGSMVREPASAKTNELARILMALTTLAVSNTDKKPE